MIEVPAGFIKAVAVLGVALGYGIAKSGADEALMRAIRSRRDASVREVARIQFDETERLKQLAAATVRK
jgi:hypothetical protein